MAVILIPGLLNDHRLWAHQSRALSEWGHVSVADITRDDSLPAMAGRILAAAPDRFHVAGLSMGGYVALELIRQAPHRISGLALVSTSPLPDVDDQKERRRGAIAITRQGGFDKIMPTMLPMLAHPDHVGLPHVGGLAKDMALAVGPDAFIRQQTAIMDRPDSRPLLPTIACPTVVIVGRQDQVTPVQRAKDMVAAIAGAKLAIIEECSHLSASEQPQAVSSVLSVWRQL